MTGTDIKISVSEDKMEVLLYIDATDLDEEMLLAKVQDSLSELKITAAPDREALQEKFKEGGGSIAALVIARGKPLVESVDGHIAWEKPYFSNDWSVVDSVGRVDYRERSTSRVVKAEELVGQIVPPRKGSDGKDVFGSVIPAPKARQNPYRCGKNIRLDEDSGRVYAESEGMIRVTNNVVEVDEIYEVDEVGLGSGNVRFPGAVVVHKDVDELSVIQAGGSVEIGGTVGAAQIEAGGDVIVRHGISGRDKGTIKCKGSVSASYILNTEIEVEGDVDVRKEITQCKICCRGEVRVDGGRIVGGEIIAQGGIAISEAGSEGNVSTLLVAGEDYKLPGIVKARREELAKLQQTHKKIHDKVNPMMERLRLLSAKQREAVTELMARAGQIEVKIEELEKGIEDITGESQGRAGTYIKIQRTLHPGVTLRIIGTSRTFTKEHKGPIKAVLDTEKGVISL